MNKRFILDADSGVFVDRGGRPLAEFTGRVVGIILEVSSGGSRGVKPLGSKNGSDLQEETSQEGRGAGKPQASTPAQLLNMSIESCWAYWIELSGKKQKLDAKRRRIIANALHILQSTNDIELAAAEALVHSALLGLWRSPHHQGQNEQRKQYLEIRYALKGIGDESDDERIEKAITWSAQYAPESKLDPARVTRYLDEIRYTMSVEHRPERERAVRAYNALKAAGFRVISVDRPPWARLER